ncbi:hypothetical protein OAG1_30940 [Agarivorans sp. OAG1]|jgi:isoaspartyl peptidase/L-asparaginase-like protein (Ntn-hydrolase superfamily)|uniref:Motility protein n=2 Tax=Agarivorans TaxID=261825 RepID=R9PIM7_AGAAL|nr:MULTISPECIES: hypothetical protein [Agarivorans]BEU04294.1 hypothetical protein OAG1_30940 [Agarivorans sp. OAG1]MEE1673983.1 hypothetical protein [Agarivorans aestuarii]MPW27857.1 hypothetical protein [Agarivorans sp. B2Z047]UQN44307.1 hypothetical protein LQZ07_07500 [Agarivorans sp. B2Z047]GAD01197.1 hypothetical protein AALB_1277 [Agarivorans albus MKT 106]
MEISGASTSQSMEVISAKLAKSQQEQDGKAVQELVAAADVPEAAPATRAGLGENINIKV